MADDDPDNDIPPPPYNPGFIGMILLAALILVPLAILLINSIRCAISYVPQCDAGQKDYRDWLNELLPVLVAIIVGRASK